MAKITRFAYSPSGELVYAKTGRVASEGYTLKERKGRTTEVYKGSKLVGRVYKRPLKAERERINKADKNRTKKRLKSELETPFDRVTDEGRYQTTTGNRYGLERGEKWKEFREWYDYNKPYTGVHKGGSDYPMSRWERSLANYAKALEKAVETGCLSDGEARAKWDTYYENFKEESVAKEAWDDMHKMFDEEDFVY